jgi:hypothetical protein
MYEMIGIDYETDEDVEDEEEILKLDNGLNILSEEFLYSSKFEWVGDPIDDKGKYFKAIRINEEIYKIGDCVYLPSPDDYEPYIGAIVLLKQEGQGMVVGTYWFYRGK